MTVVVRPAHPTEASRLSEIAFVAKRHWGYDETLIALWADELTVSRDFIASHRVYCATTGSTIVGFYALSDGGPEFELEHLWIDPPNIGSGVGTLLFDHAAMTVASIGGSALVVAADPNAEGFYRKMGALLIGRVASRPEGRTLPLLRLVIQPSDATPIKPTR